MDIENNISQLLRIPNICDNLGIEFFSTEEPFTCGARMKVDARTKQPYGYLSGGATLAMAEMLAGVGSVALCGERCAGINVSGDHMHAVPEGGSVTAIAHLVHRGSHIHVWNVVVTDDANGEQVSVVSVTNYVMHERQ